MNNTQTQCKLIIRVSETALNKSQTTATKFISEMLEYINWNKEYKPVYGYDARTMNTKFKLVQKRYNITFPQLTIDHANEIIEKLKNMKKGKKDHKALRECWLEQIGDDRGE
jgi:hypothetical protein